MPKFSPQRLRELRECAHLSRDDVAQELSKTLSTITKYEQGFITPTAHVLGDMAAIFGVEVGELFDADDPDDPVTKLAAEIKAMIDACPPFTPAQQSRLRSVLRSRS